MDDRVRRFLEGKAGVSLGRLPEAGVAVHGSPKRTEEPGNRIAVQRIAGRDGLLVTVAPGSVDVDSDSLSSSKRWTYDRA